MPTKSNAAGTAWQRLGSVRVDVCVWKSVPSSLRCQAWWVKINSISLLTSNPTLEFLLCQLYSFEFEKEHDPGPKEEPLNIVIGWAEVTSDHNKANYNKKNNNGNAILQPLRSLRGWWQLFVSKMDKLLTCHSPSPSPRSREGALAEWLLSWIG